MPGNRRQMTVLYLWRIPSMKPYSFANKIQLISFVFFNGSHPNLIYPNIIRHVHHLYRTILPISIYLLQHHCSMSIDVEHLRYRQQTLFIIFATLIVNMIWSSTFVNDNIEVNDRCMYDNSSHLFDAIESRQKIVETLVHDDLDDDDFLLSNGNSSLSNAERYFCRRKRRPSLTNSTVSHNNDRLTCTTMNQRQTKSLVIDDNIQTSALENRSSNNTNDNKHGNHARARSQ
jgi:hypothetical protein